MRRSYTPLRDAIVAETQRYGCANRPLRRAIVGAIFSVTEEPTMTTRRRIPARTIRHADGARDCLPPVALTTVTLDAAQWLACEHKAPAGASVLRAVSGPTTVHYCDAACRTRAIGGGL